MTLADRRSFLIGAGSTAAASLLRSGAAQSESSHRAVPPEINRLIEAQRNDIRAAMAGQNLEGAAVCLIYEGAPIWVEGFGVTDRPSGRAVATDTIFSIQSTSKNFTATAIMMAVQRGLLDLDAPITTYLPDFTVHSRFEEKPQDKITLRLLLSHRAGFTHEAPVGNNYDPAFPDFESHVLSISSTWLRFPVGERYRYSNLGYDLAGYILQVRSGVPFAEWVDQTVFKPLGMSDSTIATDVYSHRDNRAIGHDEGHTTVPLRTPLIPSGGVYTSARDMATYAQFHLSRGKSRGQIVLREDLWNEMHGFALGGDYSLGVIRTELRYGDTPLRMLSHKGGGFGFGSVFDYCLEAGLAWAALFNRPIDAAYGFGGRLIDGILRKRYGAKKARLTGEALAPIALTQPQLQRFVGSYVGRNILSEITLEKGTLGLRQGSKFAPLQFNTPTDAFTADGMGEATTYRYFERRGSEPAHFECSVGEISPDQNSTPADPAGPNDPAWRSYVGDYRISQWGVPTETVSIRKANGWLTLNGIRLVVETEPKLFFTADGEAVDFRNDPPTWKNLRLERVA
jgi:CubicO group peptidase (beta-lactamase class C family)